MTYLSPSTSLTGPSQMMGELSDDALLAELSADNKLAFRELTARYVDKIVRLSFRVVRNRQDAEDVAQEVFVSVWNHRNQWKAGEATFSTWIYRVAVNRAIDFKRKRKIGDVELTDDFDMASEDLKADDLVSNRQTQEMVMACLKELPEKQMLALLYFYYEEMEIGEICMRLNASEDSVRSLLKRGKASMRDIIAERFNGDPQQIKVIAPYLLTN